MVVKTSFKQIAPNSENFLSFLKSLKGLEPSQIGDIGEDFAKHYMKYNSKIFKIKNAFRREETPSKILKELGMDRKDLGTDIIIEHDDGEFPHYSLMQVKFRTNPRNCLDRKAVANMALEGLYERKKIRHLYLLSTTMNPPKNLSSKEKNLFLNILYQDLLEIDWENFTQSIDQDTIPKRTPPKPFPHQKEAIKKIRNGYDNTGKCTAVLACGSGKTYISYKAISKHKKNLVLVPTLYLLTQNFKEYAKYTNSNILLIGSDMQKIEENEININFELTTNPEIIQKFLDKNPDNHIIISTYQSFTTLTQTECKFDLCICDEAHVTATTDIKNEFATIHRALEGSYPNISIQKTLFMTATPKTFKVNSEGTMTDYASMDDTSRFGPIVYDYSIRKAINDQILTDYKICIGVHVESSATCEIMNLKLHRNDPAIADTTVREYVAMKQLEYEFGINPNSKILVCCGSHSQNQRYYQMCKSFFGNSLNMIHMGKNSRMSKRMEVFSGLDNNDTGCVIFQVRIFNLGANLIRLSGVQLLSDKKSGVDIIQTVCRPLRKHPSKGEARILLPCIFSEETVDDDPFSDSEGDFSTVRNVLKNLSEEDESIREELEIRYKSVKSSIGRSDSETKNRIEVTLVTQEQKLDIENVEFRLINSYGEHDKSLTWFSKMEKIVEYKRTYKKWPSKDSKDTEVKRMGQFLDRQRCKYRGTKTPGLTDEQKTFMDSNGMI